MGEMNISAQNNTSTFPLPIPLSPHQATFPTRKDEDVILTDLAEQLRKTKAMGKHIPIAYLSYPHLPFSTKRAKN